MVAKTGIKPEWQQIVTTKKGDVPIQDLVLGDELLASSGKYEKVTQLGLFNRYGLEYRPVLINESHVFARNQSLVVNGNVIHASLIKLGDRLEDESGKAVVVTSVRKLRLRRPYSFVLISLHKRSLAKRIRDRLLKVRPTHTYYINGLLAHNASRFWVGSGAQTWDATIGTKWSGITAGAGGSSVPTIADDVFFDGGSNVATTVTLSAATTFRSLNCASFTKTISHPTSTTIAVGDGTAGAGNVAINIVAGMTYTIGGTALSAWNFISTSTTQQTVDFAGKNNGNITFNGVGGSWRLVNGIQQSNAAAIVTLTSGTLDMGTVDSSIGLFSSNVATARTLALNSANITVKGAGATVWNVTTSTGYAVTAGTGTITFTGAVTSVQMGSTATYNNLVFSGSGTFTMGTPPGVGNAYCANLTRTGTAGQTDGMQPNSTSIYTISGRLTLTGSSTASRLLINSNTPGTARLINAAAVTLTNVDFMDITAGGAAAPWTGTSLGDANGNTNITTDPAVAQARNGVGGNWTTLAQWTSRIPLPQDPVTVDGSASGTITIDMPRIGKDVDFTGFAGTTISGGGFNISLFGSLTLGTGQTWNNNTITQLQGRGTHTLTTFGKTFTGGVTFGQGGATGGTYTLQDNLTTTAQMLQGGMTLTTNDKTLNILNYNQSTSSASKVLNLGNSTVNVTGTTTVWNWTGGTLNAGTSNIVLTNALAGNRTFAGGGQQYATLTYTVSGSTGGLIITGNNTFFNNLNFSDATNGRTLTLPATNTIGVTNFNVNGFASNLISIVSDTPGTQATLQRYAFLGNLGNPIAVLGAATLNLGYLSLSGVAGTYGSAPHSTTNAITGDIDVGAYVNPTSWATGATQAVLSKEAATTNEQYRLSISTGGLLIATLSKTGAALVSSNSTAGVPFADGVGGWIRFTWRASDGQVQFFTSSDPYTTALDSINWTQLGNNLTSTVTGSLFNGTSIIEFGSRLVGTSGLFGGAYYRAFIRNGIAGTTVLDAKFDNGPNLFTNDYLSIKDSLVTGGGIYVAGSHSTNVSDNTNWVFGAGVTKSPTDTTTSSDSSLRAPVKQPTDSVTSGDSSVRNVTKQLTDTATSIEALLKSLVLTKADTTSSSDATLRNLLVMQLLSLIVDNDAKDIALSADDQNIILQADDEDVIISNEVL